MIRSSWAAIAASVVVLSFGLILPSPAEAQTSFDCRRASHPSEVAICQDPDLASADRDLDASFRAALKRSENPDALRAEQRDWLRDLRECGDDPYCLYETYADRISALEAAPAERRLNPDAALTEDLPSDRVPDVAASTADGTEGLSSDRAPDVVSPIADEPSAEASVAPEAALADLPALPPTRSNKRGGGLSSLAIGAMFVLPILAVIGSLLVVRSLANHTMNRYNWPLILNWWNALYLLGFLGALFVGSMGMATGDSVPLGLGFFAAIWLVLLVVNIRKTDLMTGIAMTLIQPLAVFVIYMAMCLGRLWNQQYRRS